MSFAIDDFIRSVLRDRMQLGCAAGSWVDGDTQSEAAGDRGPSEHSCSREVRAQSVRVLRHLNEDSFRFRVRFMQNPQTNASDCFFRAI